MDSDSELDEEIQVVEPKDPLALEDQLTDNNVKYYFKQEEIDIPADENYWLEGEEEEEEDDEEEEEGDEDELIKKLKNSVYEDELMKKLKNSVNSISRQPLASTDDEVINLSDDDDDDCVAVYETDGRKFVEIENSTKKNVENLKNSQKQLANGNSEGRKQLLGNAISAESKDSPAPSSVVVKLESDKVTKNPDDNKKIEEFIIGDYDYPSDEEGVDKVEENNKPKNKKSVKKVKPIKEPIDPNRYSINQYQCPLCTRSFPTPQGQCSHIRMSHKDEWSRRIKCITCCQTFYSAEAFTNHKRIHSVFRSFWDCFICKLRFWLQKTFVTHMRHYHKGTAFQLDAHGRAPRSCQEQHLYGTQRYGWLNCDNSLQNNNSLQDNGRSLQGSGNALQNNNRLQDSGNTLQNNSLQDSGNALQNNSLQDSDNALQNNDSLQDSLQISKSLQKNVIPKNDHVMETDQLVNRGSNNLKKSLNGRLADGSDVPKKRRKKCADQPVAAPMKPHLVATTPAMKKPVENEQTTLTNTPAALVIDPSLTGIKPQVKQLIRCKPPSDLHKHVIKPISVPPVLAHHPNNMPLDTNKTNKPHLLLLVNVPPKRNIVENGNECETSNSNVAPLSGMGKVASSSMVATSSDGLVGGSSHILIATPSKSVVTSSDVVTTSSSVQKPPSIYCAPASHLFASPQTVSSDNLLQSKSLNNNGSANCSRLPTVTSARSSSSAVVTSNGKSVIVSLVDVNVSGSNTLKVVDPKERQCVAAANLVPGIAENILVEHSLSSKTSEAIESNVGRPRPNKEICNSNPKHGIPATNEKNPVITSAMSLAPFMSLANPFTAYDRICEKLPAHILSSSSPRPSSCSSSPPPLPPEVIEAKLEVEMDVNDNDNEEEVMPLVVPTSVKPPPAKVRKIAGKNLSDSSSVSTNLYRALPNYQNVLPVPQTVFPDSYTVLPVSHKVLPAVVSTALPTAPSSTGSVATLGKAGQILADSYLPAIVSKGLSSASGTMPLITTRKVDNNPKNVSSSSKIVAPSFNNDEDDDIVEITGDSTVSGSSISSSKSTNSSSSKSAVVDGIMKFILPKADTEDDCVIVDNKQDTHNDTSGNSPVSSDDTDDCVVIEASTGAVLKSSNEGCEKFNNIGLVGGSLAKTSTILNQLNSVETFATHQKPTSSVIKNLSEQKDVKELIELEEEIRLKTEELKKKYQDLKMISERIKSKSNSSQLKHNSEDVLCCQSCPESDFLEIVEKSKNIAPSQNHVEEVIKKIEKNPRAKKQTAVNPEKSHEEKFRKVDVEVENHSAKVEIEVIDLDTYEINHNKLSNPSVIVHKDSQWNLGGNPGSDSSANPVKDVLSISPGQDSSNASGQNSCANSKQDLSANPKQDLFPNSELDSPNTLGQDSSAKPVQDPSDASRQDSSTTFGKDSSTNNYENVKALDVSDVFDCKNLSKASVNILASVDKFLEELSKKDCKNDDNNCGPDISMLENSSRCLERARISDDGEVVVSGSSCDVGNDPGSSNSMEDIVINNLQIDSNLNSSDKTAEPGEMDSDLSKAIKAADPGKIDCNIISTNTNVEPVEMSCKDQSERLIRREDCSADKSDELVDESGKLVAIGNVIQMNCKLNKSIKVPGKSGKVDIKSDTTIVEIPYESNEKKDDQSDELVDESIEKREKTDDLVDESDELVDKSIENHEKIDDSVQETDELVEKSDKLVDKSIVSREKIDELVDRPIEYHEKTDDLVQETDELIDETDELIDKSDKLVDKSIVGHEKTDDLVDETVELDDKSIENHEKTDDLVQETDELVDETDELVDKSVDLADKSGELVDKSILNHEKTDDLDQETDEIVDETNELVDKTDKFVDKSIINHEKKDDLVNETDELVDKSIENHEKTDDLVQETDEIVDKSDKLVDKSDKLVDKSTENDGKTYDLFQGTDELVDKSIVNHEKTDDLVKSR